MDFALTHHVAFKRPVELWERFLADAIHEAEQRLKTKNPEARINKAVPLYNVALCCFALGDLDRAGRYLAEAAMEEERAGRTNHITAMISCHPLSNKIVLAPLTKVVLPRIGAAYASVAGDYFDEEQLLTLLRHLRPHSLTMVQTVVGLHRMLRLTRGPDNGMAHHLRLQIIFDLLVALETILPHWQDTAVRGQLSDRLLRMLLPSPGASSAYTAFHSRYIKRWKGVRRETAAAVNWAVEEALSQISNSDSRPYKTGVACYLLGVLRASFSHSNGTDLTFSHDNGLYLRIVGFAVAGLRISILARDGTLGSVLSP